MITPTDDRFATHGGISLIIWRGITEMAPRMQDFQHLGTNQGVTSVRQAAFTRSLIKMHHPVQYFAIAAHVAQFLAQSVL